MSPDGVTGTTAPDTYKDIPVPPALDGEWNGMCGYWFRRGVDEAVRAQVAEETGDILTVDGVPRRVVQADFWDRGGEWDSYFVWIERRPDGEPVEG